MYKLKMFFPEEYPSKPPKCAYIQVLTPQASSHLRSFIPMYFLRVLFAFLFWVCYAELTFRRGKKLETGHYHQTNFTGYSGPAERSESRRPCTG